MRVLIIGAGAVGSFIGARLALAGHAVTLAGRPAWAAAVRANGLTLIEPDGRRQTARPQAVDSIAAAFSDLALTQVSTSTSTSTLTSTSPYDLALITVKAYDTAQVIAELSATSAVLPPLLTLQNGVGNEEALARVFGCHQVVAGAIDTPLSAPAPGLVQAHRARFRAGVAPVTSPEAGSLASPRGRPPKAGPDAPVSRAAGLLRDAGFRVDVFADHRRLKWTKLLMNLPANAQCAILDWTPAQVMADPVAARLEALAWQEALAVMAAMGIRPVTLAGYPVGLLAPLARRAGPWLLAVALRRLVSGGRGSKMPSLHMALAGRKPSEVKWLNGVVADHGARVGIATPVNRVLTETLTALTEGRTAWEAWRGRPAKLAALARVTHRADIGRD